MGKDILRNENFQMPNVRHQKQRIKSLSIKACTREKVQQNCYLEGVVNIQSKTLEEKFLRCHSAQAVIPQGHSNPSAHMPGHIKLFWSRDLEVSVFVLALRHSGSQVFQAGLEVFNKSKMTLNLCPPNSTSQVLWLQACAATPGHFFPFFFAVLGTEFRALYMLPSSPELQLLAQHQWDVMLHLTAVILVLIMTRMHMIT